MPNNTLTQKTLKELLHYNPETGVFTWLSGQYRENPAGTLDKASNSNRISIDSKSYKASRLAFLYMKGYFPEYEVIHINKNGADDKWKNLLHGQRSCTTINSKIYKNNTSGVTGVLWDKKREMWLATIFIKGKHVFLGRFENFATTVAARRNAELKYGFDSCNSETAAAKYLKNI